jgi:hypothetical protein
MEKKTTVIHVTRGLFQKVSIVFAFFATFGHSHALFFVELFRPDTQIDCGKIGALEEGVEAVLGTEGTFLLFVED